MLDLVAGYSYPLSCSPFRAEVSILEADDSLELLYLFRLPVPLLLSLRVFSLVFHLCCFMLVHPDYAPSSLFLSL
jgi:hypothetical protein